MQCHGTGDRAEHADHRRDRRQKYWRGICDSGSAELLAESTRISANASAKHPTRWSFMADPVRGMHPTGDDITMSEPYAKTRMEEHNELFIVRSTPFSRGRACRWTKTENAVVWHLLRAAEMTINNQLQRELERARIDFQRTGYIPDWDFLRSMTYE